MEYVYKQADENKRKKFVYAWIFTKMFEYVQGKFNMYIKRIGTYTVREAHDRLRNSRKKTGSVLSSNWVDHGKGCVSLLKSLLKSFWKGFENDFEKWNIFTRSFEKI